MFVARIKDGQGRIVAERQGRRDSQKWGVDLMFKLAVGNVANVHVEPGNPACAGQVIIYLNGVGYSQEFLDDLLSIAVNDLNLTAGQRVDALTKVWQGIRLKAA